MSLFYLLAHQIEDRPPRIHKLAPLIDKLATYQAKFADLARRISVSPDSPPLAMVTLTRHPPLLQLSYERLRLLSLRTQLTTANTIARHAEDERSRRRNERAAMQDGRVRRRSLREDIRRVRGTIRAMRDRHAAVVARDENMNMDVDGNQEEARHWKAG